MANSKFTKKALISSVVALLLCITMLLSTTYAWFTDTVTSRNNIITSGNLDVELEYSLDGETWEPVNADVSIFGEDDLWEPGHTVAVALRIKNVGSLALEYDLSTNVYEEQEGINVAGEPFKLSDYLEVGHSDIQQDGEIGDIFMGLILESRENALNYCDSTIGFGESIENPYPVIFPGEAHVVALVITMPTTVGNEANHQTDTEPPFISFGITLAATQTPYEYDSFGNDYDEDATFPIVIPADAVSISSLEELATAVTEGGNYYVTAPITVESNLEIKADTALYGRNETLTFADNTKITVAADQSLEIYGLALDGQGEYSFDADGNIVYDADARRTTPLLNVKAGSSLKLGAETVVSNVVAKGSAVIHSAGTADNRATVILEGATIQNCAGESGTVINVDKASDVYIEEGTMISGNASYNNNNHGIIRVYNAWDAANPSTVTMNGGQINGNYYSGNGMIGLYYGKFIMNGGEINDNSWFEDNQVHNGFYPVIYAHSNSQLIMNGGEITGNIVKYGVINSLNSSVEGALTINGGTITNNIATNNDNKDALAAVLSKDRNSLIISDNAVVSGTVWLYYGADENYLGAYLELSEYFAD